MAEYKTSNNYLKQLTEGVGLVDDSGNPISPSNPLPTSATISGDVNVDASSVDLSGLIGKDSGSTGDFDVAYTSATQITASNLPAYASSIAADDIESIRQIDNTGAVVNIYTRNDAAITVVANVITVTGATFAVTDTFVIFTNIPRGGSAKETGAGNATADTERVTIADDDTNQSAIKTAVEKIDDLQNALKSVDTDELITRITDNAGVEINPAKEDGNIATIAGNTTSIDGKTPALGAAVTASSTPVNIASDQTVPVSASALPLPTGAATSANQTTANTSLSNIDADTTTIAGDTTSIDGKMTTSNTNTGSLDTKFGEVHATPTSNTLLGRLKDIFDKIASAITTIGTTTVQRVAIFDDANNQIISFGGGAAGGGSAGGGNNTYSTEQGDFTATVTNATNDIVLSVNSIGGSTITEANFLNGILKVQKASDNSVVTITLNKFTWTSGTKTLDTTNCTGAFTFATGDIVSLTLIGQDKSYDSNFDLTKIQEQSPEYKQNYVEHVIDEVNKAAGTYRVTVDWTDVRNGSIHLSGTGGVTFTLWASNDDTADNISDDGWVDISSLIMGAASLVDGSDIYFIGTNVVPAKFMIKYITSDATNSIDAWIKRAN